MPISESGASKTSQALATVEVRRYHYGFCIRSTKKQKMATIPSE